MVLSYKVDEGPQVGDLNLFNARDRSGAFLFRQRPRALHGTAYQYGATGYGRVSPGCARWRRSCMIRWPGTASMPMAARVHDVIGTRCDPYKPITLL